MTERILRKAKSLDLPEETFTERFFSAEQLQRDVDYFRAQSIICAMLDAGLISLWQFNKLAALNLKSFSPFLAEIMPKAVDNISF